MINKQLTNRYYYSNFSSNFLSLLNIFFIISYNSDNVYTSLIILFNSGSASCFKMNAAQQSHLAILIGNK
jgi:hypothetical protein